MSTFSARDTLGEQHLAINKHGSNEIGYADIYKSFTKKVLTLQVRYCYDSMNRNTIPPRRELCHGEIYIKNGRCKSWLGAGCYGYDSRQAIGLNEAEA